VYLLSSQVHLNQIDTKFFELISDDYKRPNLNRFHPNPFIKSTKVQLYFGLSKSTTTSTRNRPLELEQLGSVRTSPASQSSAVASLLIFLQSTLTGEAESLFFSYPDLKAADFAIASSIFILVSNRFIQ